MAVWPGNVCGYCGASGTVGGQPRAKYTCPNTITCNRSGCPTCMPDAETGPCPDCVANAAQDPPDPRLQ